MLYKEDLDVGDFVAITIEGINYVAEVSINDPYSEQVHVKFVHKEETISIHPNDLNYIIVTSNILKKLGFRLTEKKEFPIFKLGDLEISYFEGFMKGDWFQSCLIFVKDWGAFKNAELLFNDGFDKGVQSFYEKFPSMVQLHILLKLLKQYGIKFEARKIFDLN